MALAPKRKVNADDLIEEFAMNMVAERGGIACASTTVGEVEYLVSPTGGALPIGMLLDDVESLNFDRHPEYLLRNVVDVGSQVSLVKKGLLSTNLVVGTPVQGQLLYLHPSGYVGATRLTDGINPAPLVGKTIEAANAAGYVYLSLDL